MPKMTKAQSKKRLKEAKSKVKAVYMGVGPLRTTFDAVSTPDMVAIEKIIDKCLKRIG